MDNTISTEFIGKPPNMVNSWSIGTYGVLFKLDDGSMYMHGQPNHDPNSNDPCYPRTEPIKLSWTLGKLIYCDEYIIFKKDDVYYVVGNYPWINQDNNYSFEPIKIPIDNIVKVYPGYNWIYVCTKTECFVAGSNDYGRLGINDKSCEWIPNFRKVDWYPLYVSNQDYTTILKLR